YITNKFLYYRRIPLYRVNINNVLYMQTVITVAINVTCKIRQNLKKNTILYYKMTPVFCHICHIITHVYLHDNDNTFPWVLTGTYHTAIFHTIFGQQIIQLLSIL